MNRLKAKLTEGKKVLGCFLSTPSPDNAEILAGAGFDFLLIDHEHSFGGLTDAVAQLRSIRSSSTTSMLRVPTNDPVYFQRALDAGVECVLCPGVDKRSEAEAVVRACRYPPAGTRGAGGGLRAAHYDRDADYYRRAASESLIAVQIESADAVAALDEIASVDGIDMIIIGPRDLSGSIGKLNQFEDPAVFALFAEAERKALASGKFVGTVVYPSFTLNDMFKRGHHAIIATSDVGLLVKGAKAVIQSWIPSTES